MNLSAPCEGVVVVVSSGPERGVCVREHRIHWFGYIALWNHFTQTTGHMNVKMVVRFISLFGSLFIDCV